MPALTYANVTFTITNNFPAGGASGKPEVIRGQVTRPEKQVDVTISFGDGALTYPVGGIPITGGTLPLGMGGGTEPTQACVGAGCPTVLEQLDIYDDPSSAANHGYVPKWDKVNNKIKLFITPASSGPLIEATGAATPVEAIRATAIGY